MRHGDFLTVVQIVTDPIYLTEPFIQDDRLRPGPARHRSAGLCEVEEETDHPRGWVPFRSREEAQRDRARISRRSTTLPSTR